MSGSSRRNDDRKGSARRGAREPSAASQNAIRERAQQLTDNGMPFQMAMAVAQGRLDLNEALERLARRADVERLMERHDISRALATQISLGHADLEAFLAKRRLQQHREANLTRSCLDQATAAGASLTLCLHGGEKHSGPMLGSEAYLVSLTDSRSGERVEVHKLQIKYAYDPDHWKRVRKVLKADKELSKNPLGPVERPQDRYTCSDKRLFRYMDEKTKVDVTLLEGEMLRGLVTWFGRYEFGLEVKEGIEVTVFRHALYKIKPA